jgi:hypothetical protein
MSENESDERMPCGHPRSALRWSRWPELVPGVQTTHWCSMCEYAQQQDDLQSGRCSCGSGGCRKENNPCC